MPSGSLILAPPQSKNVITRVALIADGQQSRVVPGTFTLGAELAVAAEGTAEDVTATITGAQASIVQVGQVLAFESPAGRYYRATVRTKYEATGTSLALSATETIPTGSVAKFPAEFRIRQSADLAKSTSTTTFSSFDHDVSDQSINETTATLTFNGGFNWYDPGYATCEYAQTQSQKIYVERELPSPDGNVFNSGPIEWGIAVISGDATPAPNGGNVSANVTFAISGSVSKIEPA